MSSQFVRIGDKVIVKGPVIQGCCGNTSDTFVHTVNDVVRVPLTSSNKRLQFDILVLGSGGVVRSDQVEIQNA